MTKEELKALILGDAVAKDFADRDIDSRCADREELWRELASIKVKLGELN